jgi:hypothetical protein
MRDPLQDQQATLANAQPAEKGRLFTVSQMAFADRARPVSKGDLFTRLQIAFRGIRVHTQIAKKGPSFTRLVSRERLPKAAYLQHCKS